VRSVPHSFLDGVKMSFKHVMATKLQLAGLNVRRDTIAKTETGRRWLRDFETALHCFPTEFRQAAPSYFQT